MSKQFQFGGRDNVQVQVKGYGNQVSINGKDMEDDDTGENVQIYRGEDADQHVQISGRLPNWVSYVLLAAICVLFGVGIGFWL